MVSKVNLKARIERHSRILKDNLGTIHPFRSMYHKLNYLTVITLVIFLFPVYPLFSSFFYENSVYDFYRGDIDESTIIDSYSTDDDTQNSSLIGSDNFLSINTLMNSDRDLEGYNEVINYEVQNGDSFSSLAYKFGISNNSILWANNFDTKKVLHPGDKIKIPPVTGLIHQVKKGETVAALAKKYSIDEKKILSQNSIDSSATLPEGVVLIIPGAIKKVETPVVAKTTTKTTTKSTKTPAKSTTSAQGGYAFTSGGDSEFVETDGTYELVKRTPKWTFYRGNCTWYVAQYKNVDWSGNAREWLGNARAKGHATGSSPGVGSIVVFSGKGYNPRYGHVGIVIDVTSDSIIVRDMNYRRLNEVTVRKVPKTDRAIQGYIYVD